MLPDLSTPARLAAWQQAQQQQERTSYLALLLGKCGIAVCGAVVFFLLGMVVARLDGIREPTPANDTELAGQPHGKGLAPWYESNEPTP